ncbi:hypothetical protein RISK_003340 [Rhodopirellula islandica]|uniref:Uncharacterized protein n=1 Tax=Rhodopirellula islandica TaxID=595434 RepID=A0A0J1BDL9_RHOIS|nr:hypothetical protein RISK_003340 [Rhodopirellula islandica]
MQKKPDVRMKSIVERECFWAVCDPPFRPGPESNNHRNGSVGPVPNSEPFSRPRFPAIASGVSTIPPQHANSWGQLFYSESV